MILSAYWKPCLTHHSPYVVFDRLLNRVLLLLNTNLMSSSGCCSLISRCLVLSLGMKRPLVSMITPLPNTKSGVYVRGLVMYLILSSSYVKGTLFFLKYAALSCSSPDLNPALSADFLIVDLVATTTDPPYGGAIVTVRSLSVHQGHPRTSHRQLHTTPLLLWHPQVHVLLS